MKKIKFILVLFGLLMITVGCAARDPHDTSEVSIYGNLGYDWNLMTFTKTNTFDILYQTGNSFDDFVILHHEVTKNTLSTSQLNAFRSLFAVLDELSLRSDRNLGIILLYSSSELKQAMDTHLLTLTLDHVVVFNQLKVLINEMKETIGIETFYISKIKYIEKSLFVTLSVDEILGLELLQSNYIDLLESDSTLLIFELSFYELLLRFEEIGYIPDEETSLTLESAYQTIMNLHQR